MTESTQQKIAGYQQLKKLRTALAICQGAKLLPTLQRDAEATVSHDQTKRVGYLIRLFSRIHRKLFHDWEEQKSATHRPGTMPDPAKREEFRQAIERLVLDGDKNQDSAIFDNNGFVISTDDIAERLAAFYQTMRAVRPFDYGNRITLDFFMTALGRLPAFSGVYEHGIDFRRLEAEDAVVLHSRDSCHTKITTAFQHALEPTHCRSLKNRPNDYGKWPENKRFIAGIPFLSHTTEDNVECFVSINGGLVPVDTIEKELFHAGKHLADYPLSAASNLHGFLPGTEALRRPGIKEIDGIPINQQGEAPLFCLDVNMLTGLSSVSHADLMDLLERTEGGDKNRLFNLANNEALKIKLVMAADGEERLQRSVEIAYQRLGRITKILNRALAEIFEGKRPDSEPKLFLCMGGAGSGKTAVEDIARAQCGDNFVTTSLDEFRKKSSLYTVLTAADHHSDDYVYVEPFANRLRDMVARCAKESSINILYDGTGIPYSPRYSGIITQFKQAGFHTEIIAMDAFIVKPKERADQLLRSCVIESVKQRYEETGRALPWVVTVYKHIRAPEAFLNALEDKPLEKIALFANDGERDRHYLVAESFDFSEKELQALQQSQIAGNLAEHLKSLIRNHANSTLINLAAKEKGGIDALIARNPAFNESNVAYQIYSRGNSHRVLVVYNTSRLVDFIEKRQLNPNASGESGLLHKPESLAFDVDPLASEPWTTRLQA